jgi:hypothetical protein
MDDQPPATSESASLVRLGLKMSLGKRGEYLSDYLDERSLRRRSRRLEILGEAAENAGLSSEELFVRINSDDDAAELLESVLSSAQRSRYEPKLKYLGRCLATALNSTDDAALDTAWIKVAAIEQMEAAHVRLLNATRGAQQKRLDRYPRLGSPTEERLPPVGQGALVPRTTQKGAITAATFHSLMAVLIASGLVSTEQEVDVTVDIEIDTDDQTAEGNPSATSNTLYSVTPLGIELLDELATVTH